MASIRILSGHGRYTDPWHPFAESSSAIRDILRGAGYRVEVRDDDPSCLSGLDDLDLVIVNLGGNVEVALEYDGKWAAAQRDFGQWIRDGGRVLAVHTAANCFPDWSDWPELLGASGCAVPAGIRNGALPLSRRFPVPRGTRSGRDSMLSPPTTKGIPTSTFTRTPSPSSITNSANNGR